MSDGPTPGDWPGNPPGQPGQQMPPSYGEQGYAVPGYGPPGYAPAGYGAGPYGSPPPTHLIWAWIATVGGALFSTILGLPAGVVAVIQARKVRRHWEVGDLQAASAASRQARIWAIVSTVLDVLGVVVLIVILALAPSSKSNFNNPAVVAASIKAQLQKRISDPSSQFYSPGLKVTSVVCTSVSANTDRCIDHFSNGQTVSEIAVISANGERYLTH